MILDNLFKKTEQIFNFVKSYILNPHYGYWHCPHPVHPGFLNDHYYRGYPLDFSYKATYPYQSDSNLIPLLPLSTQHWATSSSLVYNPIVIAQWGLGNHIEYINSKSKKSLSSFYSAANWLLKNLSNVGKCSFYEFNYFISDRPVRSAMANGLAISLLLRYSEELDGNLDHLSLVIERLVRGLMLSIDDGGVLSNKSDVLVLEEYTHEPHCIFNGHVFAVIALIEYSKHRFHNSDVLNMEDLDSLINSTLSILKKIDIGFWSLYSLREAKTLNYASRFYHLLHIDLLTILFRFTGLDGFKEHRDKFIMYDENCFFRFYSMTLKIFDKYINQSLNSKTN
jgi:hypothetical protein